jgi:hypothetical protein
MRSWLETDGANHFDTTLQSWRLAERSLGAGLVEERQQMFACYFREILCIFICRPQWHFFRSPGRYRLEKLDALRSAEYICTTAVRLTSELPMCPNFLQAQLAPRIE